MKILVMGGSKFFGKRLVRKLVSEGHEVTVATRSIEGLNDVDVRKVIFDRRSKESMQEAFGTESFDIVYDQICFTPVEAQIAVETFAGRVGRYIFTSSQAVYDSTDEVLAEGDFDAMKYPIHLEHETYDYKEGKRQAEAYFHQFAPFPVVSVRAALIISGEDDYTGRFAFHVNKVANGEPLSLKGAARISYAGAEDIAGFLAHIGTKSDFAGPINAGSPEWLDVEELAVTIGKLLDRQPIFDEENGARSPYSLGWTLKMTSELARAQGYDFRSIYPVIEEIVNGERGDL